MEEKKEPILARIDKAARELLDDQPGGIIPVSENFTIVDQEGVYEVYSYRTLVALVTFGSYLNKQTGIWSLRAIVQVQNDAFDHTRTTSRHLHRFITALMEHRRVDWDKLKQLCDESKADGAETVIVPVV
jgi:hypothetical protein